MLNNQTLQEDTQSPTDRHRWKHPDTSLLVVYYTIVGVTVQLYIRLYKVRLLIYLPFQIQLAARLSLNIRLSTKRKHSNSKRNDQQQQTNVLI